VGVIRLPYPVRARAYLSYAVSFGQESKGWRSSAVTHVRFRVPLPLRPASEDAIAWGLPNEPRCAEGEARLAPRVTRDSPRRTIASASVPTIKLNMEPVIVPEHA
jgi:hypothetical protein